MNSLKLLGFIIKSVMMGMIAALFLFTFFPHLMSPVTNQHNSNNQSIDDQSINNESLQPLSFAKGIKRASPSVVKITTFSPDEKTANTEARLRIVMGSGVIISSQGYIVTNYHVISQASEITVELIDGRVAIAKVIGYDIETDLAVLKIILNNLPALLLNANINTRVGDVTLAIGHPFGVRQSVTMGIVSATGRHYLGISEYESYIQTDTALNHGNSGGALVNSHGELLGITTSGLTKGSIAGIGFAIPVSLAMNVIEQIIFQGRVIRGWLGFSGGPIVSAPGSVSFDKGAYLVQGITAGGPVDQAGIQINDVIISVNGKPLGSVAELHSQIAESKPESEITLKINRNGKLISFVVTVKERPAPNNLGRR